MKLPLSETETIAISEAYQKAKKSAAVCAKYMELLLKILEQATASIDKAAHAEIIKELERVDGAAFEIRVQAVKIKNTGLEGREFIPEQVQPE
jgi:hypothetical protein